MLSCSIFKLRRLNIFLKQFMLEHTKTCPTRSRAPQKSDSSGECPPPTESRESDTSDSSGECPPPTSSSAPAIKRALKSGPVRFGFIPDEWFLFFHPKTGVSGPYIFGIVFINYLLSKEIFVMEHEYYVGLSVAPILYYGTKTLGKDLAIRFDKDVDDFANELEKGRKDEMSSYELEIKNCKDAQASAQAQKILMDAKKENIEMQLEAIYRERSMHVFRTVKGRLEYHVRLQRAKNRIHQKWMIDWIIENVKKSLTPEFEQQVLNKAIQDIAAITGRA